MRNNTTVTTGDLAENMGEAPSDDLVTMLTRDMSIMDFVQFMQGDSSLLDKYYQKIKFRFQNAQIKY